MKRSYVYMSKKRTVHRVSDSKKNKPFVRFNFWLMVIIFGLSFIACFVLYMIAANLDDNFFDFESSSESSSEASESSTADTTSDTQEDSESVPETSESIPAESPVINPVPESERADDTYFDNVWLLTDSTLLDIKFNTSIDNSIPSAL